MSGKVSRGGGCVALAALSHRHATYCRLQPRRQTARGTAQIYQALWSATWALPLVELAQPPFLG
jgi:hypothetical protein